MGLLDRRLADAPTPALYAQRGRAHRELGDLARARRFGVRVPPPTLLEGMAYSSQENLSASLAAFDRYVIDAPTDPVGWYLRGFTNGKGGHHSAAVADLTRAITLRLPGPNAYRSRALSFIALGNTAEACADGATAAALGDNDAAALVRQHCR